jgi:hypothetical protein
MFNTYQAYTLSTGIYTIQNIPCGTEGTLTATKAGYAITYTGSQSFPSALTNNWPGEDFSAVTSYRIGGSVLVSGSGVAGATVLFDPEDEGLENITTLTSSSGTYYLDFP